MNETLKIILPPPITSHPRRGVSLALDGTRTPFTAPASTCPHCRKAIDAGSGIRKVFQSWMHDACARDAVAKLGVSDTWLMLAEQLANRPSSFKTSEIRAIVRALIDIAGSDYDEHADAS